MSGKAVGPTYYADFSGLEGLKRNVKAEDPKAIRAVAQQFESLFTSMMLKSMREAKLGEGLGDSQETDLYQGMYDQQLALKMSQGKGIGLADMLVQQLTRSGAAKAAAGAISTPTPGTSAPAATSPAAATGPTAATSPAAAQAPISDAEKTRFVQQLAPLASQAGAQLGVSANTLIGQAALETGWGRHVPQAAGGGSSQNLFGIKAGGAWNGAATTALTTEYGPGGASAVVQPFRAYSSVQQGVNDYVSLLQRSSRYQGALGTGDNVGAFAGALSRGGYATDPDYVQKLRATVASVKALRSAAAAAPLKLLAGLPTTTGGEAS
jgi:flagellar protein FlgJ